MDVVLREASQKRKNEISNIVDIVSFLAGFPLSTLLTTSQQKAILKDKIDTLAADNVTNATLLNNAANLILTAFNSLLGTNYNLVDLQNGNIAASALKDGILSALFRKKAVIYRQVSVTPTGNSETFPVGVTPHLIYADTTDWSLPENGNYSAPFNTTFPVPISAFYTNETLVKVATATGASVYNQDGFRIVAYVAGFGSNIATIVWGYKNGDDVFVQSSFPVGLYPEQKIFLGIPFKSNYGLLPLDIFTNSQTSAYDGRSGDIDSITDKLASNGITTQSRLLQVLGITSLSVAQFSAATTHVLFNTDGYGSVVEAINDLIVRLQQNSSQIDLHKNGSAAHQAQQIVCTPTGALISTNVQTALQEASDKLTAYEALSSQHRDIITSLNNYLGTTDFQNAPNFALFGDARDKIALGQSVTVALNGLNKAFYQKNLLHVAKSGGDYATIDAALADVSSGKYGSPSITNPFIIKIAPGIYAGNLIASNYIYLVGSGKYATKIVGNVLIPENTVTAFSDLSISHNGVTTLEIKINNQLKPVLLDGIILQNTATGFALKVIDNSFVITNNSTIESIGGTALDISASRVDAVGGDIVGIQSCQIRNTSHLSLSCRANASGPLGINVSGSKLTVEANAKISAATSAITCQGGEIKLLGGEIEGSVVADATSRALIGGTYINGTLSLLGVTTRAGIHGRGVRVDDNGGYFSSSVIEDVVSEIGFRLQQQSIDINALSHRANLSEEDAITENALLMLNLLPIPFSVVMVEPFKRDSNEYVGPDAAFVDINSSVLRHSGREAIECFYRQTFVGELSGKTNIIFKSVIEDIPSVLLANKDYEVLVELEISGGRYINRLVYPIQTINSANIISTSRRFFKVNLEQTIPTEGVAQFPLIQTGEVVAIKIAIKRDSGHLDGTPVIRSFVAFM